MKVARLTSCGSRLHRTAHRARVAVEAAGVEPSLAGVQPAAEEDRAASDNEATAEAAADAVPKSARSSPSTLAPTLLR